MSFLLLSGCSAPRYLDVPAEVFSERIDHLVLHFTGEDFAESMRLLTQRTNTPVSVHYLIPESDDASYPRTRLRVHRLVDEAQRAWHAGDSYWRGVTALNARSIGIEIVNRSNCLQIDAEVAVETPENQHCSFRDYDPEQLALVSELIHDILERNPGIEPEDIVGHADIAPDRRVDPGPRFPWESLYEQGIGAWFDAETMSGYQQRFAQQPPSPEVLQRALRAYGYNVDVTGAIDAQTRFALRAFQMHFRPASWSGQPDAETAAIVFALIKKYRPRALGALLKSL